MLSKLALRNVKRQVGNYLIYFMTVSFTVAMLFAISNVIFSENLTEFILLMDLKQGMIGAVVFICSIVAFVLSYATSFMLKLRKREFGTYLTLGMTRKNILTIFISETMMICVGALVVGMLLGLFIYQGLMALMMNLLEMEFSIASYSVKGVVLTVFLVLGIFLLASVASAIYLKRVSIYNLIHGDKKVEKTVKHPWVWFVVTAIALIAMVVSVILFDADLKNIVRTGHYSWMMTALFVFAVSVIIFHVGLARSLVYVLLRRKRMCVRGTNLFVLRQLSGSLSSNSMMMGFLAFLLTFTVIGANFSFLQKASQEEQLNDIYPYDIMYTDNLGFESDGSEHTAGFSPDEAEKIIQNYVAIKNKFSFNVYTSGSSEFYTKIEGQDTDGKIYTDSFMKLSDFNALIEPLGFEKVTLTNEYMLIANFPRIESIDWNGFVYERNGKTYSLHSVESDYPSFCSLFYYVVLPDEAFEGMTPETTYIAYDTEDHPYDAATLKKDLTYSIPSVYDGHDIFLERCDYTLREYGRQSQNSVNAILVIGALFAATIFLFMAMAILALKTLSTLSEDKQRYQILYRLGADAKEQGKALFHQTFSFFVLPFVVPLLISIPTVIICQHIMEMAGMDILIQQIPIIAAVIAGVMALIYLLYYGATYFIAKRVIVTPIIK